MLRSFRLTSLALALGALLMVGTAPPGTAGTRDRCKAGTCEPAACIRAMLRSLLGGVGSAQAQQVLEFKTVPPESTSKLEQRGRARRSESVPSPPSEPA